MTQNSSQRPTLSSPIPGSPASSALNGRVCLVTGASGGIGKETAVGLALRGANLVMVGRDRARGEAAVAEVKARTGSERVSLLLADLSSQASVRQLAHDFQDRFEHLHVLVNNAGGVFAQRKTTVDGLEMTFALNHLAYFLLTERLLPRLEASPGARVVNVSSAAQANGHINFDDLQGEKRYSAFGAYSQSKLANVLFTYELARRVQGKDITANALHPGFVASNFGTSEPGLMKFAIGLLRPLAISAERGAETSIYLASSPAVAHVSGQFFDKSRPAQSSKESHDPEVARRLWAVSEEITRG